MRNTSAESIDKEVAAAPSFPPAGAIVVPSIARVRRIMVSSGRNKTIGKYCNTCISTNTTPMAPKSSGWVFRTFSTIFNILTNLQ